MIQRLILLSVMFLFGCKSVIQGQLEVKEVVEVTHNGEFLERYLPGVYDATIQMDQRKVSITVKNDNFYSQVEIRANARLQIPENGNFSFSKADTGFNYNILGTSRYSYELLRQYTNWESCLLPNPSSVVRTGWRSVRTEIYVNLQEIRMNLEDAELEFRSSKEWESRQVTQGFCR